MKKALVLLMVMVFLSGTCGMAVAGNGAAPNAGDGISDGSGLDSPFGPQGDDSAGSGDESQGPAPNSGDGVPDGSGMD